MATIAVFNSKGGVGKTTLALNIAAESARAGHRTLIWEIDSHGDSSWLFDNQLPNGTTPAASLLHGTAKPIDLVRPTKIQGLSILSADSDSRRTENFLIHFARERRLEGLLEELEAHFDVIIFDNPPGFNESNRKLLMTVNLVIVPVIPSPLAMRGLLRVRDFVLRHRGNHAPILPVFSMTDKRRNLHKQALAEHADWPSISMSSDIEKMAVMKLPVSSYAPNSPSALAFSKLWQGVERKLREKHVLRAVHSAGVEAASVELASGQEAQPDSPSPSYFGWKGSVLSLPLE